MEVRKSDGLVEEYSRDKVKKGIEEAYARVGEKRDNPAIKEILSVVESEVYDGITSAEIREIVERELSCKNYKVAKEYILFWDKQENIKQFVLQKEEFIEKYKKSKNNADATVDDNSNATGKNVSLLNAEIHKKDNILISRGMITRKLKELYPSFNSRNYVKDLENHIIYKHDESSFAGPIAPYCVSISMYPFILGGTKTIGGSSKKPENLAGYCGSYCNLLFAIASQYAGAVATPEFLLFFDWFARKEWGDDYYLHADDVVTCGKSIKPKSIKKVIEQHFQGVIYSINSPASSRNSQSPFVNFSYFDKPFFETMFENFYFPDGTAPKWESLNWLQKEFMMWFNEERTKTVLTFPVESFALIYRDGKFVDEENADFVAEELERGHSFFIYISDTADSLSSCCFGKDQKVLWKSSTAGVNLTTLEELYNLKWEPYKKNLRIFHNGSWVKGKAIKLENRPMYRVLTENNKEMVMTDNHINVTLNGEKRTDALTTDDYLMFNTQVLNSVPENDENLTYEQGFVIGAFLGDGSMGSEIEGTIYDVNFSQNKDKYEKMMKYIDIANKQIGGNTVSCLSNVSNNVYPVRISSKKLVAFIKKWTNWERGTYAWNKELNLNALLQSVEFRKGILDGWYNTDGGNSNRCYTTSPKLAECMEALITSLGMQSMVDISDKTDEPCVIRGVEYHRNYPLYCVRWYEPANHRKNKDKENTWIKKNNSIYFKIKSIEKIEYTDDVYCIECNDKEEPYFTLPSGVITHNCRLKNKIQTKEFSFTNGNIGVETGSKSVITLNLNRITQDFCRKEFGERPNFIEFTVENKENFRAYIAKILGRVYKYHTAYNEYLWDMYDAGLLPVYKAGFIDLNKQYLTVGINGLNQAAEYLGLKCSKNDDYKEFCGFLFSIFENENNKHRTKKTNFNLEFVPAESLAVKNYNWDKEDGYWVPDDTNLYASYVFKPNENDSVLDRLYMMSNHFAMDKMSGGAAAHINLDSHLSKAQYKHLLNYCGEVGCTYWTINVPNSECECGYITKHPISKCPKCGSTKITYYDRVIGYMTKIKDWSEGRRIEQKTRVYNKEDNI